LIDWSKTICGNFDRIDITANHYDDWLHIKMDVGGGVHMTLRSTEAVRDLHYALGRYLDCLDKAQK